MLPAKSSNRSVTLNVNLKTPIPGENMKKKTFTKIQILPWKFFPAWFSQKEIDVFECFKVFYEKSAHTDISKEMCIPMAKGGKHLNIVLNAIWGGAIPELFCIPKACWKDIKQLKEWNIENVRISWKVI